MMEQVESARKRCSRVIDTIHKLPSQTNITESCKRTLLKLAQSELHFLSSRSTSTPHHTPLSVNIGHLEAVIHILQQPCITGVSRVCKPIPSSLPNRKKIESLTKNAVHVDIVCTLNKNPVWIIVSDRNPRYVSWFRDGKSSKGLKFRLEQVLGAAQSTQIMKPCSIVLFFSHGISDFVNEKLREEFGACQLGLEFALFDFDLCEELEGGEWINVVANARSFQEACVFEIKVGGTKENTVLGSKYGVERSLSLNPTGLEMMEEVTKENLDDGFDFLISEMKLSLMKVKSVDVVGPGDFIGDDDGDDFINLDTTALIAIVSGISNGCTEKLLAAPEDELRKRFKGNYEFVIVQVKSEIQNPILAEMAGVIQGKRGIICESVLSEFKQLVSMCGGPNEKLRADKILKCLIFMEKSDNVCVRFTGKNYAAWTFQLEIFLKGKELWGHIDGSDKDLVAEGSVVAKAAWAAKDALIMSWILSSMEPHLILSLRPYRSAKAMWDHLTQVYNQDNNARRFQLELAIANYTQGDLFIQDYYSGFLTLWSDYSDLVTTKVFAEGVLAVQQVHKINQRDQFLMKLQPEYEPVRASLVNRDPVPSLDACFGELLREEQRLHTQTIMEQARVASASVSVAYVASAYSKGKSRDMSKTQCYSCKKYGYIAPHCPHKICNYCKQLGHIIKECHIRPPRPNKVYHAAVTAVGSPFSQTQPPANLLTREMVQEMIVSAFSTLGLQGTGSSALTWILDSGASNHMKNSLHGLSNIRKYCGSSHIQTANGSTLPIIVVGDVPPFLNYVFAHPSLL